MSDLKCLQSPEHSTSGSLWRAIGLQLWPSSYSLISERITCHNSVCPGQFMAVIKIWKSFKLWLKKVYSELNGYRWLFPAKPTFSERFVFFQLKRVSYFSGVVYVWPVPGRAWPQLLRGQLQCVVWRLRAQSRTRQCRLLSGCSLLGVYDRQIWRRHRPQLWSCQDRLYKGPNVGWVALYLGVGSSLLRANKPQSCQTIPPVRSTLPLALYSAGHLRSLL